MHFTALANQNGIHFTGGKLLNISSVLITKIDDKNALRTSTL